MEKEASWSTLFGRPFSISSNLPLITAKLTLLAARRGKVEAASMAADES